MKLNIISYTSFFFIMVMFFPSLIFAPWTTNDPPKVPTDGIARTCPEWIEFNEFTLDNYEENRKMAKKRNYKLDKQATMWAAIYAFIISGEIERPNLLPRDFCDIYGHGHLQTKPFLTLENERKTCDQWITLYIFSENNQNNFSLAVTQKSRLSTISIWAHIYYLYVAEFEITNSYLYAPLAPIEFCTKIGKSVEDVEENHMSFMSENDTRMTCHDWIHLYEYTDNPVVNYHKAFHSESQNYFLYIHYFPFNYAKKLLREGLYDTIDVMTPELYCREYNGEGAEPRRYELFYLGPRVRRAVI